MPQSDVHSLEAYAGRSLPFAGGTLTVKEDGSRTRGEMSVVEFALPAHAVAPPQHLHRKHEETWYVLDGELEFTIRDRHLRVGPGGWVIVPIGVPHSFSTTADAPARLLATMTPGFYLHYFEQLAQRLAATPGDGPPDPAAVGRLAAELMPRYATELYRPA